MVLEGLGKLQEGCVGDTPESVMMSGFLVAETNSGWWKQKGHLLGGGGGVRVESAPN